MTATTLATATTGHLALRRHRAAALWLSYWPLHRVCRSLPNRRHGRLDVRIHATRRRMFMEPGPTFFHSAGYLKMPQLLTGDEVNILAGVTRGILAEGGPDVMPDGRSRVHNAVSTHLEYLAAAASGRMVGALAPLLGPDIELAENRHNHVSVCYGPCVDRLHRDVLQWSRSIVTVLLYLSDCTEIPAATRVVPGSHLWPSTGGPNNGGTWLDQSAGYADLAAQAVAVPAAAGDALLLHGQLYHCGAGAASTGPRIVFTLAYRSADELSPDIPINCRLISGRRIYRGRGVFPVV